MFSFFGPKKILKTAVFSLFSGFFIRNYYMSQETNKTSWIFSNLNLEIEEILKKIGKNLDYSIEEDLNSKKTAEINVRNNLNEEKCLNISNHEDLSGLLRFSNPPRLISKEELFEVLEKLPENESVFLGFFEKMNRNKEDVNADFNELKYRNPDAFSHYYLINEENNKVFGLNLGEVLLIKPMNSWNSSLENVVEINNRRFFYEKRDNKNLEFSEDLIKIITTDNEMINVMRICKEKKKEKFLIYHPIEKNDPISEQKILRKFVDINKETPDIMVLYLKNENLLTNYFRIIPEKFIDTVRMLDFSRQIPSEIEQNTEICLSKSIDILTPRNFHSKLIPQFYNLNKFSTKKIGRFKYEGKITRNRLKNFITKIQQSQQSQYYECTLNYQENFSQILIGKNFKEKVLNSSQDWLIFVFKPDCTSCKILKPGFEKFANLINEIEKDPTLISKYKILNIEKFKNLKIARYNLFNECQEFANPSNTPILLFFRSNKTKKPIILDLLKERVNINNPENVVETLIRIIDNRL